MRIDVEQVHEHPTHVELLRLFSSKKEYEINGNPPDRCRQHALNNTMHPAFSWVAESTLSTHECHSNGLNNGTVGFLWMHDNKNGVVASVCVSKPNANIPYWSEYTRADDHTSRHVRFFSFTPGVPDPSQFKIPTVCS